MRSLLNIVILAAGQGKRMNSKLPKVLQPISNKPMLHHVIETAKKLNPNKLIVVYGHGGEQVQSYVEEHFPNQITWAFQDKQLGTGHALKCALPYLDKDGITLVLYGDVPLITEHTLNAIIAKLNNNLVMLSDIMSNPIGYGRVVRDLHNNICAIVEEKDASTEHKKITEVNTGFYAFSNTHLEKWLNNLSSNNAQGEYYLTDVVAMAYEDKLSVASIAAPYSYEVMGVNNKLQLEELERIHQVNLANQLLLNGVTLIDKKRIDIRGEVVAGQDCIIDVNCIFEGKVTLGNNVTIGAGCIVKDTIIADNVIVQAYSIIDGAQIGEHAHIGPYARLRPATKLSAGARVGNFVEIKKSTIGVGSKVNHLTYVGDSTIGNAVNIGAGTVTCNYDGQNKFNTIIGDNVFIGSGSMLVAPVTIGDNALIAAGSVITKNAPDNELTVSRAKQITIVGWKKRKGMKE